MTTSDGGSVAAASSSMSSSSASASCPCSSVGSRIIVVGEGGGVDVLVWRVDCEGVD